MNFKTTGVLLVLAAISATFFLLSGRDAPSEFDKPANATVEKPFVIDPQPSGDDVVRIAVVNQHGDAMAFEREAADEGQDDAVSSDATWRVVEPVEAAAERWTVQGLTTTFFALKSQRSFDPGEAEAAPSETGLDKPRGVFTLTMKDDTTYTFTVGRSVAVSNDTYLQVEDASGAKRVHVVPRDLNLEVGRKLKDYRGKSLFPRDRAEPVAVRIDYQGKRYAFTRNDDEQWVIDEPIKAYADNDKVSGLVNRCTSMYVREFIDDAPASLDRYGLAEPELIVRITGEANEEGQQPEYAVEVGAFSDLEKTNRYIKLPGQPWVASVAQANIDPLVPNLSELRDSRVARIEPGAAEKIELTRGETAVTLVKENGEWSGDGDLSTVEAQAVSDLLAALEDVRAIDYIDEPGEMGEMGEYGLDAPRMTISVTAAGSVDPVTVAIGANTPSDRNTYVRAGGQSSVLVVSSAQADRLAIDPMSLRSRKIFALRTSDITSIESTVHGQKRVLKQTNNWTMTDPEDAPIDAAALRDLLNDVAMLRAASVVGEGAFGEYGLDDPDAILAFTVSDEAGDDVAGRHMLRMSTLDDKTYCRKDDEPYVFELDSTVVPTLSGELIDRALLAVKADQVQRIAIMSTGQQQGVEFERGDGGWTYTTDPTVQVNAARVDEVVDAVAGLRVQRYLAYSDGDVTGDDLATPEFALELGLGDEHVMTLRISHADGGDGTRSGAWDQHGRVFVLPSGAADSLTAVLDWYLGEDEPEAGPQ